MYKVKLCSFLAPKASKKITITLHVLSMTTILQPNYRPGGFFWPKIIG